MTPSPSPKYDNSRRIPTLLWLLPALLGVLAVRLHGLPQASLSDYDSVRNWQIVQEVAAGNLRHLFHHGSPGFYLLFAPVAALQPDFHWFQFLNVLLATAAIGWLAYFVGQEMRLPPPETALLALLAGTSTLLTFSARDFTMSSLSLLAFVGLWRAAYCRLRYPAPGKVLRVAGWVAAGLCINYKFLLVLPILAVLEWQAADVLLRPRLVVRVLLIVAAPYLLLGLVGVLAGLPWWRWPATYYGILFPAAANAAGRAGNVRLDLLFYPRFLVAFESPVQWLGLGLFPGLFWRELRAGLRRVNLPYYAAVWAYCLLGGMSLLLKAPRGLLFAYPLFVVLGVLGLRRVAAKRLVVIAAVGVLAVGNNLWQLQQQVYAYTPTTYPAVAAWLRAHGAQGVVSTVGQGLAPYVAPDSVVVITDEAALPALRRRGYRYVLLDGYWRVAGVHRFRRLRQRRPVATWREPALTSPLQFLEHAEFTGLTYAQTLQRQHQAAQDSVQLALYELR